MSRGSRKQRYSRRCVSQITNVMYRGIHHLVLFESDLKVEKESSKNVRQRQNTQSPTL